MDPVDLKDPNLQTGPFPEWPTLPPMAQPKPHYLENDPTPWQGGDFPSHTDPLSIVMALLGARATGVRAVPAGAPRNPRGVVLSRNLENPAQGSDSFHYNMFNDSKPVGEVHGNVENSVAHINWIGAPIGANAATMDEAMGQALDAPLSLGAPAIRQLIRQFQQDYPKVGQIQGERVSGAKSQPGTNLPDLLQIIKVLKHNEPTPKGANTTPTAIATALSIQPPVVPGMFRAEEARAAAEPELPFAPAVNIGGKIYTGAIHDFAVEKARQELGQQTINDALHAETARANAALAAGLPAPVSNFSGFMTNKGRYVSREEAAAMVPQANRLRIHSSDLPRYNKEGQ